MFLVYCTLTCLIVGGGGGGIQVNWILGFHQIQDISMLLNIIKLLEFYTTPLNI